MWFVFSVVKIATLSLIIILAFYLGIVFIKRTKSRITFTMLILAILSRNKHFFFLLFVCMAAIILSGISVCQEVSSYCWKLTKRWSFGGGQVSKYFETNQLYLSLVISTLCAQKLGENPINHELLLCQCHIGERISCFRTQEMF